jgi:hypothetical protein
MTTAGMSAAIKAQLDADFPIEATNNGTTERQHFCDRLAAAIVGYIQANALVSVTTACGAGAGTGTGTVA